MAPVSLLDRMLYPVNSSDSLSSAESQLLATATSCL